MDNLELLKRWHKFNCYTFDEPSHTYYYNGNRVKYSVTQFIAQFFKKFDSEVVSKQYAKTHNLDQAKVLAAWSKNSLVASLAGTIIHSYLENINRGKILTIDYSAAEKQGVCKEVLERVNILLPKAQAFYKDMLNKLFPVQLEYTVGIEDIIAGNIDMLCWNEYAKEFQIWDYKNTKTLDRTSFNNEVCLYPFNKYFDCNYIHYCIQLNIYKYILQKQLGIEIGKLYLVHFDYQLIDDSFEVVTCINMQHEVDIAIENLMEECHDKK